MTSRKRVERRSSGPPPVPAGWKPRASGRASLLEIVDTLPADPGVYIMRDRDGRVVYVGKAQRLRQRVQQYFTGHDTRDFVTLLDDLLGDIETIVTRNNKEAMLLENTLIKQHQPRFNVKLRDDKQYLMLRLDPKGFWPRLEVVRNRGRDQAQYFGPYHSAASARQTLRVVNRHFRLRTCTDFVLRHRKRPCLQYQIDRCPAPCVYDVDGDQYAAQVKHVGLFLSGRHRELTDELEGRMQRAAAALEFETAARLRDQLNAVRTTLESQRMVGQSTLDQDAVGYFREGGQVEFLVMHVRSGKVTATLAFSERGMEQPDATVLGDFLAAYYEDGSFAPDEVLLPHALHDEDDSALREWLRELKGKKVEVAVPERGPRRALTRLAAKNAANNFASRRNRDEDLELALTRLQSRLRLTRLPRRIECYDISHIQGSDPVGSMVVFVDGQPDKSKYRKFKIRGLRGLSQGQWQNDDFASMYEVLTRRIRHALDGNDDDWALPDLMVIDGGKGQLSRVLTALADMGIAIGAEGLDVVSLAKEREMPVSRAALERIRAQRSHTADPRPSSTDGNEATGRSAVATRAGDETPDAPTEPGRAYQDLVVQQTPAVDHSETEIRPERVFLPHVRDAIRLRNGSSELFLMTRLRDEAHRFAIGHHRDRRSKRALTSVLDQIPGVGPALKKALIQHFGTVAAIRSATPEALVAVPRVGPALAKTIIDTLRRS
ncbi:MAG: excinuclease ABC subunit UvrC [Myxococcales bacterium FL481]|nr:MAG: excinuclease ABC subunit UvrC [Myxococcales bacterium FL481]